MGEFFDAVEWIGLDEEEAKKLIEKYNKKGKEAGFGQQSTTKRPRLDKNESNKETRDSRNTRDIRDRRNNCEYYFYYYSSLFIINLHNTISHACWIKIKIEVAILGVAPIWEVGEEKDHKGVT